MGRTKGSHNKHKKEKVHKEKKKRGRPSKQTQHQKQNQVVNVTINNSDGGGNGKKKKNVLQEAMQSIPNMIFNPSLSIPQGFPIARPETNPPFYDMNSLIPDFNNRINPPTPPIRAPQPTPPITPIDVQPTQPNPIPNQPIKPVDVQPNTTNSNKPNTNKTKPRSAWRIICAYRRLSQTNTIKPTDGPIPPNPDRNINGFKYINPNT